jgi:phosphoribosyl-AMP cyclohydrolase
MDQQAPARPPVHIEESKMPFAPPGVAHQVIAAQTLDDNGLIPAIAQQHDTGEVLMMAWMNAEAVRRTLEEGVVHYYSRSRQALWRKGDTSGHIQHLRDFRYDCDSDTILVLVDQAGVACHTGRRSCFFRQVTAAGIDGDAATPLPSSSS